MIPDVRSLSEQIYDWLKERIFKGDLASGQRVVIERVAADIGVSRTPVREAINRLAHEGLVTVSPRRGTVVGSLTIRDVEEIYEARSLIEPAVCEAIAARASQDLITDLHRIQEGWESLDPKLVYRDFAIHNRYAELDTAFHMRIVAEFGNERLKRIYSQLTVQRLVAPRMFGSDFRGPAKRIQEHRQIVKAIERRDSRASREAMLAHLRNSRDDLVAYLKGADGIDQPIAAGTVGQPRRVVRPSRIRVVGRPVDSKVP